MAEFVRLAEVINKKQNKRIVSVSVIPTIADCSGRIWFTDLQLQEGTALTGYIPHTEKCLKQSENAPAWFNGVVRSKETVIIPNLGGTSAGLDIHLSPKQDMAGGTVALAQGVGGQRVTFPNALKAGDDVALLADTRECTRNGKTEKKVGFFQYSAAWDSKHIVELPQGKSAQVLFEIREMDEGGERF